MILLELGLVLLSLLCFGIMELYVRGCERL